MQQQLQESIKKTIAADYENQLKNLQQADAEKEEFADVPKKRGRPAKV